MSVTLVIVAGCVWYASHKINAFFSATKIEKAALELELKQTRPLATINKQLVQEIKQVKKVSSEQIARASDSIFQLKESERKLIKENSRLAIITQEVTLKNDILAGYVQSSTKINLDSIGCDSARQLLKVAIIPPLEFLYESDSITITGIVQPEGVAITGIKIIDTLYERDVKKKTGFLKLGRQLFTQIYHTNSMFSSDNAQVFTIDKTPSWWYRTGKPVAVATLATTIGVIITKAIIQSQQ